MEWSEMEGGKKRNGGKQKRGKEMRKIENSAVNHNFLLAVIEPMRVNQIVVVVAYWMKREREAEENF
jgi:hypothetical protein